MTETILIIVVIATALSYWAGYRSGFADGDEVKTKWFIGGGKINVDDKGEIRFFRFGEGPRK